MSHCTRSRRITRGTCAVVAVGMEGGGGLSKWCFGRAEQRYFDAPLNRACRHVRENDVRISRAFPRDPKVKNVGLFPSSYFRTRYALRSVFFFFFLNVCPSRRHRHQSRRVSPNISAIIPRGLWAARPSSNRPKIHSFTTHRCDTIAVAFAVGSGRYGRPNDDIATTTRLGTDPR